MMPSFAWHFWVEVSRLFSRLVIILVVALVVAGTTGLIPMRWFRDVSVEFVGSVLCVGAVAIGVWVWSKLHYRNFFEIDVDDPKGKHPAFDSKKYLAKSSNGNVTLRLAIRSKSQTTLKEYGLFCSFLTIPLYPDLKREPIVWLKRKLLNIRFIDVPHRDLRDDGWRHNRG